MESATAQLTGAVTMRILLLIYLVLSTFGHYSAEHLTNGGGGEIDYFKYDDKSSRSDGDELELEMETRTSEEVEKSLELGELDADNNATESNYTLTDGKNELVINDFIRFKRDMEVSKNDKDVDVDVDVDNARPKREHEKNEKILLSHDDLMLEGNREPRGATKEQWIKQPYPVQTTNPHPNYEDNIQSASETARAPRVHFVTQRRSESAPPLVYHYDREARSRDFNRDGPPPPPPQYERDYERERDYYPRPARHYNPQNYPYRSDPYYADRRQDYPDYPSDRYFDEDRPMPVINKQPRIIYYATLPEVVRNPPNANLRDRYGGYRDRQYDNRFVTSSPVAVGSGPGPDDRDSYRFRTRDPYSSKSRYDEATKAAYPTKVSTDVNVREIKKNPERRIYSEADRRYAFKGPTYRHDDVPYDRNLQ